MRLFGKVTAWWESPFEWGFYRLYGYRELCFGWLKFGWLTDEAEDVN